MANPSLGKNIPFFGAGTISSAHLKPDIRLMFMSLGRRVHHRIFAFRDCVFPQFHCHPDHIKIQI